MNQDEHNWDDDFRAIERGDLDALTPEAVARLETLLHEQPDLTRRVGHLRAQPDERLAQTLDSADADTLPDAASWERVWRRIDGRAQVKRRAAQRGVRILQLWPALTAAAAGLVLAAVWNWPTSPAATEPWTLKLATQVEIQELEVYDGAMPFVVSAGGDHGAEIIWVLEPES